MIDERTEQLINRKLDGELTADESLELDKLLIRSPQARALLEEYAVIDEQATQAIETVVARAETRVAPDQIAGWGRSRLQMWYSFGLVTAVAAAVSLAVMLSFRAATMSEATTPPGIEQSLRDPMAAAGPAGSIDQPWRIDGPRRETLDIDRDVIGVWDRQSHSLYLIEADNTRSMIEPVKANY
jgi:anti-sigma factor RsiW